MARFRVRLRSAGNANNVSAMRVAIGLETCMMVYMPPRTPTTETTASAVTPAAVWMIDGADGTTGPYTVDELRRALRPGDKLRMGTAGETAPELAELRAVAADIARLEARLAATTVDERHAAELRRRQAELRMARAERRRLVIAAAKLRTDHGREFEFTARSIATAAGISHTAVNKLVADL